MKKVRSFYIKSNLNRNLKKLFTNRHNKNKYIFFQRLSKIKLECQINSLIQFDNIKFLSLSLRLDNIRSSLFIQAKKKKKRNLRVFLSRLIIIVYRFASRRVSTINYHF